MWKDGGYQTIGILIVHLKLNCLTFDFSIIFSDTVWYPMKLANNIPIKHSHHYFTHLGPFSLNFLRNLKFNKQG